MISYYKGENKKMSVYELANKLADQLANAEEYKRYKRAVEKVQASKESVDLLSELRSRQMEIQNAQMSGTSVPLDVIEDLEMLSQRLIEYDDAAEFLEAELYFGQMMGDVQQTITEAVEFWTPPIKE